MQKTLALFFLLSLAASAQQKTVFPLKASPNKRHLVDQNGRPFLYVSDSGWKLLAGLTESETKEYLQKRQSQGFNTIHVMLTALPGDKNRQGHEPFADNDFAKPNEAWFSHADRVAAIADSMNMLLAIAPLWYSCCNDGWASHPEKYMHRNGREKSYLFGQYAGNRYKKFGNIIWIIGGDNDPDENREETRQLARGIKQAAPLQLVTYHAASTHSSTDVWPSENWLDFSMVYTYFRGFPKAWNKVQPDVYEVSYAEYRKSPLRPFLLGESAYEGEHDAMGSALQVRKQAYWAMLSGACGHSYGSPFWKSDAEWRKYVDLPGANSLKHLNELFGLFDWTTLVPDVTGDFILSGNDKYATNDYATAALTKDRRTALVYVPSARAMTVNTGRLAGGKQLVATWFNPRSGEKRTSDRYPVGYKMLFESPDKNDWVLLLQVI